MEQKRKKQWITAASAVGVAILAGLFTLLVWKWLSSFSQEGFRDYIRSFGVWGWLVMLGLQILQVFVALIPGELLESGAGYIFGPWGGLLICYLGIAIGSVLIFLLTRRFGIGLVELFVSRRKISELRFINTEKKRNRLIFLIYLIPGTPKDLLTYLAGLTEIPLGSFLGLSLVARAPSVVSSLWGGQLLSDKNYWGAALLYGVTALVSFGGLLLYGQIVKRRQNRQ